MLEFSEVIRVPEVLGRIPFVKMHGLGNDYIFVNRLELERDYDWPELARKMSRPHFGIGSDGLILILPSDKADLRMRMFNADGSEGEMCGNGIRCFARYAYEHGLAHGKKKMEVETLAGIIRPEVLVGADGSFLGVRVDMGEPVTVPRTRIPVVAPRPDLETVPMLDEEIEAAGGRYKASAVSMGNPHCVIFVDGQDSLERLRLEEVGPALERHEAFPRRANVEFAAVLGRDRIKVRVWERGSGITLACGTGACATVVAGAMTGRCDRKALVELPGGSLEIEWSERDGHVYMTGGAETVFEGTFIL